jgi:hypothetical protein
MIHNMTKLNSVKYYILCIFLLLFNNLFADNIRNLTISNQCDFDVLWGIDGTPIKDNGNIVKCNIENTDCFNGQGFCGSNGLCYFKYPTLISGKDDKPDFYLSSGSTKDYEAILIKQTDTNNKPLTQYRIKLGIQSQCTYNDITDRYECKSGDCARDNAYPLNGQCKPNSSLQTPYTQAEFILNNGNNDFYSLNIMHGINVPMSITPLGTFGSQKLQTSFFCKVSGGLPTGHPDNMSGCTWKFNPPTNKEIKPHLFTQIHRDLDADLITICQTDAECNPGQKCGLKYPEDLQNYHYSAYCGIPIGYNTTANICTQSDISPELQHTLQCERIAFDETNTEIPIPISETDPVEKRCPNNFTTLSLNGIPNSERKFCNYEILQCATKIINISGKNYKYLDSCYNYNKVDPESSACCGCVDWPNIPSDDNNLCLTDVDQEEPTSCNIDLGAKPPYCKKHYTTNIRKPNSTWLAIVKPHLQWLIDGCPDAKEYKYGNKHSTQQCSSKNTANEAGNNINYLITLCPNGKSLFSDTIKATTVTISDYDKIAFDRAGEANNEREAKKIDLASMLIFIVFTLLVFILVIYYASKRDS